MLNRALISALTWRSLEMQREAFPDMPHFIGPDEIPTMLRASTRRETLNIHVVSLAIPADTAQGFLAFMARLRKRKAILHVQELGGTIGRDIGTQRLIALWQAARRNGAAKAGGEENAKRAEREFWEGFAKIKDRWHLPAKKTNASKPLLKEAGTSRNTAKSYLSYTREEWQRLPETKRNRILEKQYAKAD